MSRHGFVKLLAAETGWQQKDFAIVLECFIAYIVSELKTKGEAEIPGLVKFRVSQRQGIAAHRKFCHFAKAHVDIPAKPPSYWVRAHVPRKLMDDVIGDGKNVVVLPHLQRRITRKSASRKRAKREIKPG